MATISKKGKGWQVQIRTVGHRPICKTFKLKSEAKTSANDVEAKLDRCEMITHDDMTVSGLVRALRDEPDDDRLLTAAYRTSLNHIDRRLCLKWVSRLSAKDIKDFAQARRKWLPALGGSPGSLDAGEAHADRNAVTVVAPATLSPDIMHLKNLLETGRTLHNLPPKEQMLEEARKELQ